jgi:DNA-binding CsgD family transcriptional regulator
MLDRSTLDPVARAALGTVNQSGKGVVRLSGVDAVLSRLAELASHASAECLLLLPAIQRALPRAAQERATPTTGPVRWRGVYQQSLCDDPYTTRWLSELGAESRTAAAVPILLAVVDRTVALLAVAPHFDQGEAVELHGSAVEGMRTLFEEFWSAASPVPAAPLVDGGLTPQQREVVRLLAEGLTDEVISRRIGVSLRTVRRIASELMVRLTARSRFEAGVKAAQLGWLEHLPD